MLHCGTEIRQEGRAEDERDRESKNGRVRGVMVVSPWLQTAGPSGPGWLSAPRSPSRCELCALWQIWPRGRKEKKSLHWIVEILKKHKELNGLSKDNQKKKKSQKVLRRDNELEVIGAAVEHDFYCGEKSLLRV